MTGTDNFAHIIRVRREAQKRRDDENRKFLLAKVLIFLAIVVATVVKLYLWGTGS